MESLCWDETVENSGLTEIHFSWDGHLREISGLRGSSTIKEEIFIDGAIFGALKEYSFSSLRQIAKRILIPMSAVRYHLVNFLLYRIRNIRWVPHSFSSSQKQARVEMSQELLQVLRLAKHHAWKYIVTLDEAWLYFSNHIDRIWLPHDELRPSFPKQTTASQKITITVVWNPRGFHMPQSLSKRIKWTGRCYSDNILSQIAAPWDIGGHRKMIVHADKASVHVAKCVTDCLDHQSLKRALHPSYSPDLSTI
jgi:hypothetical protein